MSDYIHLSPWARNALTVDEIAGLHARAAALGAHVFATSSGGRWTVHAAGSGGAQAATYHAKGSLAVAINGTLDRYRDEQVRVDAELAAIMAQALVEAAS